MKFDDLLNNQFVEAVEPLLPGFMVAAVFLLFTLVIRIRFRGQEIASRVKRPQTLLFVYVLLFAVTTAAHLYWTKLFKILHLASLLVLVLAVVLAFSVIFFDLFLDRYRKFRLPSILKDVMVLGIYVIVVVMVLGHEGVEVTSLVTTSAVLTAIIGFALQDLLSNVVSGLSIQIETPFQVGDWVAFENSEGEVLEINWRATKILTLNNDIVVIPNNVATRSPITNFSVPTKKQRREFTVGLRYEVPPNLAHASLLAAVSKVDGVLTHPAPTVQTRSYDDFSIQYRLRYFIDNFSKREQIGSQVATRVWYRLKRDGLTIPFPIRDINLTQVNPEKDKHREEKRRIDTQAMIATVPVFSPLSPDDIKLLAENSVTNLYATGETIISQGEKGSSFFLIADGEVDVWVDWGGGQVEQVSTLGAGDYFGERSLMTGENRSATVKAITDCSLVVVEKGTFAKVLQKNPTLVETIGKILDERESMTNAMAPSPDESTLQSKDKASLAGKIRRFFQITSK